MQVPVRGITDLQIQKRYDSDENQSFSSLVPGFSMKGLPNLVKIGLSAELTMCSVSWPGSVKSEYRYNLALLAMKEVVIRFSYRVVTQINFLLLLKLAGNFVDFQVGRQMGAVNWPAFYRDASY